MSKKKQKSTRSSFVNREAKTAKFYHCACYCYSEGLTVYTFDTNALVVLSICSRGKSGFDKLPLRIRLKAIWDLLIKGRSDLDDIVLSYDTARRLSKDLLKRLGQK